MTLPLLISVPHAGKIIPPEVEGICLLTQEDIIADSDEGADAIYYSLKKHCTAFFASVVGRAIIDLNRAPDDIGGDGVIKSHTCWNVPVYRKFPDKTLIKTLLKLYYFPYHEQLSASGDSHGIKLGIDCHTMSSIGPPVGPDPGRERPIVCVSNADETCPREWISKLSECLGKTFNTEVSINSPFRGGYITRKHASEMFWVQIEISRTTSYSDDFKRECLLEGLQRFCHAIF